MAFVNWIPNNPGYTSTERSDRVGADDVDTGQTLAIRKANLGGSLQVLYSPGVDTSGMVKPFGGWLTYTGGGGGGPTRPTTGMLYPRGQG